METKQIEISNVIAAKVMAPYLGCQMVTKYRKVMGEGKPSRPYMATFNEIDLGMVTGCIGVLMENETDKSNHMYLHPGDGQLLLSDLKTISDQEKISAARKAGIVAEYVKDEIALLTLAQEYFKVGVSGWNYRYYQTLQEAGFDLPHALLGFKTLKEVGLATYDNPIIHE